MKKITYILMSPPSESQLQGALVFMRVGIGILMIGHGFPKIIGGIPSWQFLGGAMGAIGIHFLPIMWGFIAVCTEFFGGILLTIGLATRITSFFLTCMMFVATMWHLHNGDPFMKYANPLSLMIIFITFIMIGGGKFSLDTALYKKITLTLSK